MKTNTAVSRIANFTFFLALFWAPAISAAIDNSECLECHSDASLTRSTEASVSQSRITEHLFIDVEKFNQSVHNENGIQCVDCHSDIEELNFDDDVPHKTQLEEVCCSTCHEEEGEAFMKSVHMEAREKGITMRCNACHGYHYVTRLASLSVAERENDFCLKCHNPYFSHDWLTQKKAHFDFVECTVCHAPEVPRHFHLQFFDLVKNTFLEGSEVIKILGINYDEFMPLIDKNEDNIINNDEFEILVLMLRQKSVRVVFHAELVAELQPVLHHVNSKDALRDCRQCHSPDSPFFNAVTIVLTREDSTVDHYNVDRSVLEGYYVAHFSALAATRVRLLDKIGLALIGGGICVVLGHLMVRLVTIPIRRRKREQKR